MPKYKVAVMPVYEIEVEARKKDLAPQKALEQFNGMNDAEKQAIFKVTNVKVRRDRS